jgi:hypothetical protein
MKAMLGSFCIAILNKQKFFVFLIMLVFSSPELKIRAEQVLPGSGGRRRGTGGRKEPNNVCICE